MKKSNIELLVGIFVLVGFLSIAYLAVRLGQVQFMGGSGYKLNAEFDKIGGLKEGTIVEIAGVDIGKVLKVSLDPESYQSRVTMHINDNINVQEDAIVSIKSRGLLGEKYVQISPGASEIILKDGERIRDTESAVDIGDLIAKFAFGKVE